MRSLPRLAVLTVCVALVSASGAQAPTPAELADGVLVFDAPDAWEAVRPRSNIVEREYAVAAPEGVASAPARLTIMASGGSVDANLARWVGQFRGTEGGADRSASKKEKLTDAAAPTTLLDIQGVYLESAGGPFGPKTPRPGYRMLGAIVETEGSGNYFFKLVGPADTVGPQADAFRAAVVSLRTK